MLVLSLIFEGMKETGKVFFFLLKVAFSILKFSIKIVLMVFMTILILAGIVDDMNR